jgi:hypothetical protein
MVGAWERSIRKEKNRCGVFFQGYGSRRRMHTEIASGSSLADACGFLLYRRLLTP